LRGGLASTSGAGGGGTATSSVCLCGTLQSREELGNILATTEAYFTITDYPVIELADVEDERNGALVRATYKAGE